MTIDEPTHKGSPLGDEHVGPASGCYWCWYGGEAWMAGNDKGKEEMTLAIIEESKDAPHLEHPMTGDTYHVTAVPCSVNCKIKIKEQLDEHFNSE